MARKISNEIIFLRGVLCKVLLSLSLRVARGASDARASVRLVWNYSLARFRQRTLEEEDALDPFSPALLHPNVVKGGHLYIFAPLKVTPFFLIRHSPSPPISLSLSRRIPRGVGWGGQGIHESSLCTACQRFLPDPPPTCAFLADPCFNCLLHDKRVASHEGQIFRPGKFSLFPLR